MKYMPPLHSPCPLQMFGPENGVCNYLTLEKIYGMLILRIRTFSPSELQGLYVVYLKKSSHKGGGGGGGGGGVTDTPGPPLATPM